MSSTSRVTYFRFIEAQNYTYRLEVIVDPRDNPQCRAIVRWSDMRETQNRSIMAETLDAAEAKALDAMYNHLTYILRVDRIVGQDL